MNKTLGLVLLFLVVLAAISWNNPYAIIDSEKLTDSNFVSVSEFDVVGEANYQNFEQQCQCPDGWICEETFPGSGEYTCVLDPDFIPPHPEYIPPQCSEFPGSSYYVTCIRACLSYKAVCEAYNGEGNPDCQTQYEICRQNCLVDCNCHGELDGEYEQCYSDCSTAGGDSKECVALCLEYERCLIDWCAWNEGTPTLNYDDNIVIPECDWRDYMTGELLAGGDDVEIPNSNINDKKAYVRSEPLESTTSSSTASSSNDGDFVCPPGYYGVPDGSGGYICIPYDSGSNPPENCESNSDCEPWGLVCASSGDNEGTCVECNYDNHCPDAAKPYCTYTTNECAECKDRWNCPAGYGCVDGKCEEDGILMWVGDVVFGWMRSR